MKNKNQRRFAFVCLTAIAMIIGCKPAARDVVAQIGNLQSSSSDSNVLVKASDSHCLDVTMKNPSYTVRADIELSPMKFFLVEFPAGDEIETVVSQDKLLVKMDEAFEKQLDARLPVLLRAGAGWGRTLGTTSVLVMMKSGAMLQLEVSTASTVEQSIDRVVWRYNIGDVVKNRRSTFDVLAELPDAPENTERGIVGSSNKLTGDKPTETSLRPELVSVLPKSHQLAQEALIEDKQQLALAQFNLEAESNPDIDLYTRPSRWVNDGIWTLSVVGVRNKTHRELQLVDFPRLQIENRGKKGEAINEQDLEILAAQTTALKTPIILAPGDVVYFSLVFETPVLGTDQGLKLLVTHTNAANNPAVTIIHPGGSSSSSITDKKSRKKD